MKIDLCIPAHNEAATITTALQHLRMVLPSTLDITLLVAENGSTDGTAECVERANIPNVRLLRIAGRGKGFAIREAARVSRADVFGFIDADLSADPAGIPDFLAKLEQGADIVIGSRAHASGEIRRGLLRTLTSRSFNLVTRVLFGLTHRDTQCGLKFMNARGREMLLVVRDPGWIFDIELLFLAKHHGLRVEEHPVSWEEFRFPGRRSKLRPLRDGLRSLRTMLHIRQRLLNDYGI